MEIGIAVVGIVLVSLWFLKGAFSSRMNERDKADEEYQKALEQNRKADAKLSDPDHVKRVQDRFNS